MTDYTDIASVRKMNALFTSANIPNDNITEFISVAQNDINTALGRTTDLSDTEISNTNVKTVASYRVCIDCVLYDRELFDSRDDQKQLEKFYRQSYTEALDILKGEKGTDIVLKPKAGQVLKPTTSSFSVATN